MEARWLSRQEYIEALQVARNLRAMTEIVHDLVSRKGLRLEEAISQAVDHDMRREDALHPAFRSWLQTHGIG